jgi:predicted transposase/invertase (TIGR01784 family)
MANDFLSPKSDLKNEDGSKLWNWMKFLSAQKKEDLTMATTTNPMIQKAVARLEELSADERTRLLYESRQKMMWDIQGAKNYARQEGFQEGRQEGRQEGKFDVAKALLLIGDPIDKIVQVTGLSREEIEKLVP